MSWISDGYTSNYSSHCQQSFTTNWATSWAPRNFCWSILKSLKTEKTEWIPQRFRTWTIFSVLEMASCCCFILPQWCTRISCAGIQPGPFDLDMWHAGHSHSMLCWLHCYTLHPFEFVNDQPFEKPLPAMTAMLSMIIRYFSAIDMYIVGSQQNLQGTIMHNHFFRGSPSQGNIMELSWNYNYHYVSSYM